MRLLTSLVSLTLATSAVASSSWFSKAAYNKWHETELERWLSDHDIPYPTPADRKDLEKVIQDNWDAYAVSPYKNWDTDSLSAYLKARGIESKQAAAETKDSLISQVQSSWYETEDKAESAWGNARDWILDTWTESSLKSFCDKNNIPVPQPRNRDNLLQKARSNYEAIAKKAGEAAAYPGNWLYESWSDSDLKEWLDTNGFPAPQPTSRDKLVASVRRNSRLAYLKAQEKGASASDSANAAYATLTDKILDAWSESQLKEFADKNGINVPQGTKTNELRALIRKRRASLLGDTVANSAASAYGAATSKAGNQFAQATEDATLAAKEAFDSAINAWSDTRMKAYLDARGVPVPHASKTDELRALVRKNAHKAVSGYNAWTWDDLSLETLKAYLARSGNAAAKKIGETSEATREELTDAAQSAYASASSAGGDNYASATAWLASATDAAKTSAFDTWSETELKAYLDSYGIPVPQGSTLDSIKAQARKQSTYFKYGTSSPTGTAFAKLGESVKGAYQWVVGQVGAGSAAAKEKVNEKIEL